MTTPQVSQPGEVLQQHLLRRLRALQLSVLVFVQAPGLLLGLKCGDVDESAGQGRVHEDALAGRTLSDLGPEPVGPVGLLVDRVDNSVDPRLLGVGHALRRRAVGGGVPAELVGLVADSRKPLDGEPGA